MSMYPGMPFPGDTERYNMGALVAWDARQGKAKWTNREIFPVYSGPVVTKGGVVIYGTLDGLLKVVDAETGTTLWSEPQPSGVVSNIITYDYNGKQYIAVLSGIGGWAGIGLAAGLASPNDGLGAVGTLESLQTRVSLGGTVVVYELGPDPLDPITSALRALSRRPIAVGAILGSAAWFSGWLLVYLLFPRRFCEIARYLERNFKIPLPYAKEVKIPAHWLILGWLWRSPRVLDAWIGEHVVIARTKYNSKRTVADRDIYVPVPVRLDDNNIREISGHDLSYVFERQGPGCLLIWGEGGSGKTNLACQLGKWLMETDAKSRPMKHVAIPILVERELDFGNAKSSDIFLDAIRTDLSNLIDSDVDEEFTVALLSGRRILVIVDHYSEMSAETRKLMRPDAPGRPRMATVFTSRIMEDMGGISRAQCEVQRITGEFLSNFLRAYLEKKELVKKDNKRVRAIEAFPDEIFFPACSRLAGLVGTRSITAGLVSMYADQLVADKQEDRLSAPPRNIPQMILSYVNERNRSIPSAERIPTHRLHDLAKRISWVCIKGRFRMSAVAIKGRNAKVISDEGENEVRKIVDYFVARLQLCEYYDSSNEYVIVKLDPVAECLAALRVVETNRENETHWRALFEEADAKEGAPERIRGFLYAVRDCCLAYNITAEVRADAKVPLDVLERIERRLGLDPEEERERRTRAEVQRLIGALSPERGLDERRGAVAALGAMRRPSRDIAAAFLDALADEAAIVQKLAMEGIANLEMFYQEYIPKLSYLADTSEDKFVAGAAKALVEKIRLSDGSN
jgi:adenylate kinase family enzyme